MSPKLHAALKIANEQMEQFEQEFYGLLSRFEDMPTVQLLIKPMLLAHFTLLLEEARDLMNYNYTERELNQMQEEYYLSLVELQKIRAQVFKNIMRTLKK
jgi:hypothetical protein